MLQLPFRRLTSSPRIGLASVAQLLSAVCALECHEHKKRPIVQQVVNGRIAYATCCQEHLDTIEKSLQPAAICAGA